MFNGALISVELALISCGCMAGFHRLCGRFWSWVVEWARAEQKARNSAFYGVLGGVGSDC